MIIYQLYLNKNKNINIVDKLGYLKLEKPKNNKFCLESK